MVALTTTPMHARIAVVSSLVLLLCSAGARAQTPARWAIEPTPVVTIGQTETDTSGILTAVVGATRLPNGMILVGDHGDFSLRLFSPGGKLVRAFGRKGAGPGEVGYLKSLLRCGDSLVTLDIDPSRVSVFALDGHYIRSFRFDSPQAARAPYKTVCNRDGAFAHYGWESMGDVKGGAYRPVVPFWLSGASPDVRRVIGNFPGSERFGLVVGNQIRGSRPLPLGRQTEIAMAQGRVYIGTADQYEILAFDSSGRQVAIVRGARAPLQTTRDDITYAMEREIADVGEARRAAIERGYADMALPKTMPAYAALRVDVANYLWVQDYPRTRSTTVSWSVFDPSGRQVAEVPLPVHLEVYEIGTDYVLGRFMNPDEAVPQVRLYRLTRGSR